MEMGVNKIKDKGKLWEKRRRDRLKESFQKLARLLPQHDPAKLPPQNEILDKATEFVKELRLSNSRLLNQQSQPDETAKLIQELQDEVNKLILRVKQLTVLLQQAKIPIPAGPFIKSLGKRKLKWTRIVASDDLENSCKSRRLVASDNEKASTDTVKQGQSSVPPRRGEQCLKGNSVVPLRETNATGKEKKTGASPVTDDEVQILSTGETCITQQKEHTNSTSPNQPPAVSQTTVTLTPTNPLNVPSALAGAMQGFPATIIISQPCITSIGHNLQHLHVASQSILPKHLPNTVPPKIAISRITQPIIKQKKTRRRKKKSDIVVQSTAAEIQTVELSNNVEDLEPVEVVKMTVSLATTMDGQLDKCVQRANEKSIEFISASELNSVNETATVQENADRARDTNGDVEVSSGESMKDCAEEKNLNSTFTTYQVTENNNQIQTAATAEINPVTATSSKIDIPLNSNVCCDTIPTNNDSLPTQEGCIEVRHSTERVIEGCMDDSNGETHDEPALSSSAREIAQKSSTLVLLKPSSDVPKKIGNSNTSKQSNLKDASLTNAVLTPHVSELDCAPDSLNNITDTFDDIEAIIIPNKHKVTENQTAAMKTSQSSETKDKPSDIVESSMQEDEQLTSDKISECIARSIDLIDQPGSELMDLSAEWGDGSSPKYPMSPTKMFLSMFPLSLRESSATHDQTNAKSCNYSSGGKSSFHIDAMLPDDTCANSSNCNTPLESSLTGITSSQSVCTSLQALNNPSDDYLSIVSSFVAGSSAKNAIEGFNMNLSSDVDAPEGSNPFSFSLNLSSADMGTDGNFLNVRTGSTKDTVGCLGASSGGTEKENYMSLPSWISKPNEKFTNIENSISTNTSSIFTNYPPYRNSSTGISSSMNMPTLLPLIGNPSSTNSLNGDSASKKKASNKRDVLRWPGAGQNAGLLFHEPSSRSSAHLQQGSVQANTGHRNSSSMQFTISDLMGSVNAENSSNNPECTSRRSQAANNSDLFSTPAATNRQPNNENVCQYKPYEDHSTGFTPINNQAHSQVSSSQSAGTANSTVASVPSYIPDFQSGYAQYNPPELPVATNPSYGNGFSNAQSFVPADIYTPNVVPTNNLVNTSQRPNPKSSSQDLSLNSTKVPPVTSKTQHRTSKAKASREDRSKQSGNSKQTLDSAQIRHTATIATVDVTRRNFETWSSSSYIYNDLNSRVPSSVNTQTMPKGAESQAAPAKTKPPTKVNNHNSNSGTSVRKLEKNNGASHTEATGGRSSKGSCSGMRPSQRTNTNQSQHSRASIEPHPQPKSKPYAADENVNSMAVPVYPRNSSFYDQTVVGNQAHNQLFYLPDVTQVSVPLPTVPSIEMLPFQHSIPPIRNHGQSTDYQTVGLMTPRNLPNETRSNNYSNYIAQEVSNPTNVRNPRQRPNETSNASGHLMQNIFSHSATADTKNVQHQFSATCPTEVQRINQDAGASRSAILNTKKTNSKATEVSYSNNIQETSNSQTQNRQQQSRTYSSSEIPPAVNTSAAETVSWPTSGSRGNNNNSCQQKPDSSVPNAFSVSKLMGNTTSSSNNHTNNNNRHCVEGLIRKSCATNWDNFNSTGTTSLNSYNPNPHAIDNSLSNATPKLQAYQPAGTHDYGNYNFMPMHSHHQVAQASQPSHQPYATNMQPPNHQTFPTHFNYFDASSANFVSTPSQVPQIIPGGNSGIHQSNVSPRNTGRGNGQENQVCHQQSSFPRFHHGSNHNNTGIHLQQHQQQATSSVSNFNLSSIFPEMNQEVSCNSGERTSHQPNDSQRDNCSSGYYQNQRQN